MTKQEFKDFCHKEFVSHGFQKGRKLVYCLKNKELLCGLSLQASSYGGAYYIQYYYYIGDFTATKAFPEHYDADYVGRVGVMTKRTTDLSGKCYITYSWRYEEEEYTEDDIRPYLENAFDEWIMPPMLNGKKQLLHNFEFDKGRCGCSSGFLQKIEN